MCVLESDLFGFLSASLSAKIPPQIQNQQRYTIFVRILMVNIVAYRWPPSWRARRRGNSPGWESWRASTCPCSWGCWSWARTTSLHKAKESNQGFGFGSVVDQYSPSCWNQIQIRVLNTDPDPHVQSIKSVLVLKKKSSKNLWKDPLSLFEWYESKHFFVEQFHVVKIKQK